MKLGMGVDGNIHWQHRHSGHTKFGGGTHPSHTLWSYTRGWHPHTLVNAFLTRVKILDRPNWSLDRFTVS